MASPAPQWRQFANLGAQCSRGLATDAATGTGPTRKEDEQFFSTDRKVRKVCVIAHVDHGKTSLTDKMLKQVC